MSHFDKYREELATHNLHTLADLETRVKQLARKAVKMEVQKASRPPENSTMLSHFGGQPYFEKEEIWPLTKKGQPLQFIFQVFKQEGFPMPAGVDLVQFYYDDELMPWDSADDGWKVKIYSHPDPAKANVVAKPAALGRSKYCEINFKPVDSYPDWEGISTYDDLASKLSCVLNEDEPWENYRKTVEKIGGQDDYCSQLGGYPKWVQGESTPAEPGKEPMELLFQVDSEEHAGLMWGDVGLVYVFYDAAKADIEFILQCH